MLRNCVATAVVLSVCLAGVAGESTLSVVEIRNGKTVTTGKVLARGKERAVLLDRKGALHYVELKDTPLKPVTSSFQSFSVTEFRNQLSREFGKEFEIGSTRHYLVVAPSGRAVNYAAVFEEQYATLQRYLKTRSFVLNEVEFPLVAIVFPNRDQFTKYAQADSAKTMTGMLGYYSPRTNRVALFESRSKAVVDSAPRGSGHDHEFALTRNDRRV